MAKTKPTLPTTTLAIFGVSGDLSRRYLLPALAEICESSEVSAQLNILGLSRQKLSAKDVLPKAATGLAKRFEVMEMDYSKTDDYKKTKSQIR